MEQFTDDLAKIEKAITRREKKIKQYDLELETGRERLQEVLHQVEHDRRIREEGLFAQEREREDEMRREMDESR